MCQTTRITTDKIFSEKKSFEKIQKYEEKNNSEKSSKNKKDVFCSSFHLTNEKNSFENFSKRNENSKKNVFSQSDDNKIIFMV